MSIDSVSSPSSNPSLLSSQAAQAPSPNKINTDPKEESAGSLKSSTKIDISGPGDKLGSSKLESPKLGDEEESSSASPDPGDGRNTLGVS